MERPSIEIASRAGWRAWLAEHHATSDGVWVVYPKQGHPGAVAYEDLVLEALCFGWVDSQARGVDERRTSISMTPRRPRSRWTQPNRDRVAALTQAGLMTPAGLRAVQAAQESGAWDELRPVEALQVPPDLAAALEGRRTSWDALTRSARYQHLLALHDAKRPETRTRRIEAIIAGL